MRYDDQTMTSDKEVIKEVRLRVEGRVESVEQWLEVGGELDRISGVRRWGGEVEGLELMEEDVGGSDGIPNLGLPMHLEVVCGHGSVVDCLKGNV